MANRPAEPGSATDARRRGPRCLRRVARYALIGLAISVAGVLVAAPFGEDPILPHFWVTQKHATAWVSESMPYTPGEESFRYVMISGTYVGSTPEEVGMPRALESLLLEREDGQYDVWWSGFPIRSVCGWYIEAGMLDNGGPPADIWHGIVRIPIVPPHFAGYLPFRPLWLGLLGNVAVNGLTVFLAVEAFRAWRRAYRRENGKCIGCGYELAGLEACPECGRGAATVAGRQEHPVA